MVEKDFLKDLVMLNIPGAILLAFAPKFFIIVNPGDFLYDKRFAYYGYFNISKGGSLTVALNGKTLDLVDNATTALFTNPMLVDTITASGISFIGYRIDISG